MVSAVKLRPIARPLFALRAAALGLALLAVTGVAPPAHAENELRHLWRDMWRHKAAPAPKPHAPAGTTQRAAAPVAQPAAAPAAQPAAAPAAQPSAAPAQAPPPIPVVLPKLQSVSETLTLTGNAEAVNQVKLVARVPGYLEQIHFQDGQIVKKDDLLFTVQQDQYQAQLQTAQAQLEAATVARDHAKLEVGRYTALLRKHATSQVDVDHWVYELKTAEANIKGAQGQVEVAALNLDYTEVHAPFDGQMSRHLVDPGNMVGGDGGQQTLAEITQLDPIYVVANISSDQALQIRQNLDQRRLTLDELRRVPVEVQLSDETGFPHRGALQYVSPQIDAKTGTLYVRGILENPDRTLLPGMFVNMRLPMGKVSKSALLVPQQALQADQGGQYLFVVGDDGVVQKRYVQVGEIVGAWQVATSGISRNDRIVIGELWRVSQGMKVTPQLTTFNPAQ
jgi:RND family efflux transporter MFP subunit